MKTLQQQDLLFAHLHVASFPSMTLTPASRVERGGATALGSRTVPHTATATAAAIVVLVPAGVSGCGDGVVGLTAPTVH